MLLDRRGEDFAHRRRTRVDEDDQRQIVLGRSAGRVRAVLAGAIDLLIDARATRQEMAQQAGADVNAPARVAAQVKDQGVDALRLEGGEVLIDGIDHRRLREAAQHDVADVVVEHAVLDELQMDLGARDGERQLARIVTAADGDVYLGADGSAHQGRHFVESQASHRLVVNANQHVARVQASVLGGRVLVYLDDARLRIARADADADTDVRVVAARPGLVVPVLLGVKEVGMALVDEAHHAAHQCMRGDEAVGCAVRPGEIARQGRAHELQVHGAVANERRRRVWRDGFAGGFLRQVVPGRAEQRGRVERTNVAVQQQVVRLGESSGLGRRVFSIQRFWRVGGNRRGYGGRNVQVEPASAKQPTGQDEQDNQRAHEPHMCVWRPVIPVRLGRKKRTQLRIGRLRRGTFLAGARLLSLARAGRHDPDRSVRQRRTGLPPAGDARERGHHFERSPAPRRPVGG